jgi:uncharacterized protein (DUF2384 family)
MAKLRTVNGVVEKWCSACQRWKPLKFPASLLDTSAGERDVEALLDRIEYGVYS